MGTYDKLKSPGVFLEEILGQVLRGIFERRYGETGIDSARAFGVSPSAVSKRIEEATIRRLKEFKERDLSNIFIFAVFIDTIHRGGQAFMVCLGIDRDGNKHVLGFWQGARENQEICDELLADIQRRGLSISKKII